MSDPAAIYAERLRAREADLVPLSRRDARLSRARVATFVAILATIILAWQLAWPGWVVAIPTVGFAVLLVVHDRALAAKTRAERAVAHYRSGLERLADEWRGKGVVRTDFRVAGAGHPFAADLDVFGEGSLLDRICRARTRAGEETLASWLSPGVDGGGARPLPALADILGRQRAVAALRDDLDLREALAVEGPVERVDVDPDSLVAWGRGPASFSAAQSRWLTVAGVVMPAAGIAGLVAWGLGLGPWLAIAAVAVDGAIYRACSERLATVAGPADRRGAELAVLARLLALFEARPPDGDPLLTELRDGMRGEGGETASRAIARLRRLLGWYEAQRNGLFFPVALLLLWAPSFALAIERWRLREGPKVGEWIAALGRFEALTSLAGHGFEHPDHVLPELVESTATPAVLEGRGLAHPLLPATAVRNDLALVGPTRAYVVSGSNMAGKSTYLRTIGTNVVLALAGGTVRAQSLRLSPVRIGATLRIQDSLHEGTSRFWAELERLRTVSTLADEGPTLFLLDEILHGTNSHDRRIGAEALLRSLVDRGAIGLLTTHDLALARAAESLAPRANNVHFADELVDGELVFDYRMRAGVVQTSNALALMRSLGLLDT